MDFSGFLKIEKTAALQAEVVVSHHEEPRFAMEVDVVTAEDGTREQGAIKRVVAANSGLGNYGAYALKIEVAERFLEAVLEAEETVRSRV
ncbi:MAG: hypothetical protein AAGB46_02425 [Verrucomicrobiota bacterium]